MILDIVGGGLIALGLLLATIGLYGLLRLPDIFHQLHPAGLVTGPAVILVLLALVPTLVYYWSVGQLAVPTWNIDTGGTWGSYLGLFFLAASFTAIGVFASSLTDNQIVAFLIAVFLCFAILMVALPFRTFTDVIRLPLA